MVFGEARSRTKEYGVILSERLDPSSFENLLEMCLIEIVYQD